MNLRFYRLVQDEVNDAMEYYEQMGGIKLAGKFYDEVMLSVTAAVSTPERFHPTGARFRRANLKYFPYHLLYEIRPEHTFVTVVKHNRRRPSFGTRRK